MSLLQRALRSSAGASQLGVGAASSSASHLGAPAGASQLDGGAASTSASQPGVLWAEDLLKQVRQLGRYPRLTRNGPVERELASQISLGRKAGRFDAAQEAELDEYAKGAVVQRAAQATAKEVAKAAAKAEARKAKAQSLVDQVVNLGYIPREYKKEEAKLARQMRDARKDQLFDSMQLAKLEEVQTTVYIYIYMYNCST